MGMFTEDEEDEIRSEFEDNVNMSLDEAKAWKDTDASKEASLSREPIEDLIKLKEQKSQGDWRDQDDGFNEFDEAQQLNSFVARMKGVDDGEEVKDTGLSDRDISLLNWGHVPENERKDFEKLI